MKLSRTVHVKAQDLSTQNIPFMTQSIYIDGIPLGYDVNPVIRDKILMEIILPENEPKIELLGRPWAC